MKHWRQVFWNAALLLMVAAGALLVLSGVFAMWNGTTGMMVLGLVLLITLGYCLMEVGFWVWGNLKPIKGEPNAQEPVHPTVPGVWPADPDGVRDSGEPGIRRDQD